MYIVFRRFLFLFSFLFIVIVVNAQEQAFVSSGDEELDRIRLEVTNEPTSRDNFELRALKIKLWVVTLQQQGARLEAYLPIDEAFRKDIWWNTIGRNNGLPQPFSDEQMARLTKAVDRGYAILDSIQNTFGITPTSIIKSSAQSEVDFSEQPEIPWSHYKGNKGLSALLGHKDLHWEKKHGGFR
jgi:hypothetical protein